MHDYMWYMYMKYSKHETLKTIQHNTNATHPSFIFEYEHYCGAVVRTVGKCCMSVLCHTQFTYVVLIHVEPYILH